MAELTINEYRSRLHILSQKADADGRHKVSEFTLHLLKQENPDLKILDAIFKYYDSITDSDTVVYNYLLDNKASVEWFYFAGFLSDHVQSGFLGCNPLLCRNILQMLDSISHFHPIKIIDLTTGQYRG
mgnify:CR=1 FL=1